MTNDKNNAKTKDPHKLEVENPKGTLLLDAPSFEPLDVKIH